MYRSLVMDALNELADRAYQERVWSGLDPHLMSSLTECTEELFDDSGLAQALDRGSVFGQSIDEKLLRLGDWLSAVDATQPILELLRDESLVRSRALATEILDDLEE
ncbi:MAG: hypothetical protein ACRCXL_16275 [Dermatophilaceae bacterium]